MIALILLVLGVAMLAACRGRRALAIGLFAACFVVSAAWLGHHMTDRLALSF